jgi:hypothetical protein
MAEETQDDDTLAEAPLGGTRRQAMQLAQVGLFGLALMTLLIGLAQIIQNQTRQAEAGVVPEAAPTVVPSDSVCGRLRTVRAPMSYTMELAKIRSRHRSTACVRLG